MEQEMIYLMMTRRIMMCPMTRGSNMMRGTSTMVEEECNIVHSVHLIMIHMITCPDT